MKFNESNPLDSNQQSWWNRPLWGNTSMMEMIIQGLHQEQVPNRLIEMHNQEIQRLLHLSNLVTQLDEQKFTGKEFLLLLKIKSFLVRDLPEYRGLAYSTKLLMAGIKVKNLFQAIEDIELHYRGLKQQELYNFVGTLLVKNSGEDVYVKKIKQRLTKIMPKTTVKNRKHILENYKKALDNIANYEFSLKLLRFLLTQNLTRAEFIKSLENKVQEIMPQIQTKEGKEALESYAKTLKNLAEQELGLELLSLFKKYQLTDYWLLQDISEIINKFQLEKLDDSLPFFNKVKADLEIFTKLGKIIGVSEDMDKPEHYANILQYICLTYKYQEAFDHFKKLVVLLQEWQKRYQIIKNIRLECDKSNYRKPKEFNQDIPGLDIYNKYKVHLAYLALSSRT